MEVRRRWGDGRGGLRPEGGRSGGDRRRWAAPRAHVPPGPEGTDRRSGAGGRRPGRPVPDRGPRPAGSPPADATSILGRGSLEGDLVAGLGGGGGRPRRPEVDGGGAGVGRS